MRIIKTISPVARIEHVCNHCRKTIAKGERYLNQVYINDGKFGRLHLHIKCQETTFPKFEEFREAQFRKTVREETEKMLNAFTLKENVRNALFPLIITEMAWAYTDKVLAYCAEHKMSQTVKLSRTVKRIRQEYLSELEKDLKRKHIDQIVSESNRFLQECSQTLTLLWFQIDQCIKNQWTHTVDLPMVIDAQIALLMLDLLDKNEQRIKKLFLERLGKYGYVANPKTEALRMCLKAYNKYEVVYSDHVRNCVKVIENKLNTSDFDIK